MIADEEKMHWLDMETAQINKLAHPLHAFCNFSQYRSFALPASTAQLFSAVRRRVTSDPAVTAHGAPF